MYKNKPEYVFLCAAMVGGIEANRTLPASFIFSNLQIQTNVIAQAFVCDVRRLLFLGSSCVYPRLAEQPIKEESLLSGPLEPTNRAYAVAKIAGIEMCRSYNYQCGTDYRSVMPTNLYGPGDNYDALHAHVIPALIRRMHEAKENGDDTFTVWGSGEPLREFLYVDDLAEACVTVMKSPKGCADLINIGSGREVSIKALSFVIREVIGFKGDIRFDPRLPDGTPRKLLDSSRIKGMGWCSKTSLWDGIDKTYEDFKRRWSDGMVQKRG